MEAQLTAAEKDEVTRVHPTATLKGCLFVEVMQWYLYMCLRTADQWCLISSTDIVHVVSTRALRLRHRPLCWPLEGSLDQQKTVQIVHITISKAYTHTAFMGMS